MFQAIAPSNREVEQAAVLFELARPLTHEFNNFLNTLLLQIAVIQEVSPGALRDEFASIRQEARAMANLIRQWQRYRRAPAASSDPADLHEVVREVVGEFNDSSVELEMSLAPECLYVAVSHGELKRLCYLVLANAHAAVSQHDNGRIHIETALDGDQAIIRVQDNRPDVVNQDVSRWFDSPAAGAPAAGASGSHLLEIAACQSMARRLKGKIHALRSVDGDLIVEVRLPAAEMGHP
jgi:C4-dicarboxylate-specific signal transduction histidine kinase